MLREWKLIVNDLFWKNLKFPYDKHFVEDFSKPLYKIKIKAYSIISQQKNVSSRGENQLFWGLIGNSKSWCMTSSLFHQNQWHQIYKTQWNNLQQSVTAKSSDVVFNIKIINLNVFFLNTFISLPTFTFLLLIVRLKGTAGFYTSSSINDNTARDPYGNAKGRAGFLSYFQC